MRVKTVLFSLIAVSILCVLTGFSSAAPSLLGPNTIADTVDNVGGAIVNIDVVAMQKQQIFNPFNNFNNFGFDVDPNFKNFFQERMVPIKGSGSGFIIDDKGHIITNSHVVNGADKIKVTLKDSRSFDAKLVGLDTNLDLAVLKITGDKIPWIAMGDSDKIRPGEWVIAIGNPYGFSNTVTAGIISGVGRSLSDLGKKDLIQTDAPINPGNSGGPLINLNGQVIGVNVAVAAGAQGIGFAIPINDAKSIMSDLINKGKVMRPWLGIYMKDVDPSIAAYLNLPIPEGIVVVDVVKGSPAEKSGMLQYDVVRELDGSPVKTSKELYEGIKAKKIGDIVTLYVYRNGKLWTIKSKLAQAPK